MILYLAPILYSHEKDMGFTVSFFSPDEFTWNRRYLDTGNFIHGYLNGSYVEEKSIRIKLT